MPFPYQDVYHPSGDINHSKFGVCVCVKLILFFLVHVEICDEWEQDKSPPRTPPLRQKAPYNEIIIESYYIFLY